MSERENVQCGVAVAFNSLNHSPVTVKSAQTISSSAATYSTDEFSDGAQNPQVKFAYSNPRYAKQKNRPASGESADN